MMLFARVQYEEWCRGFWGAVGGGGFTEAHTQQLSAQSSPKGNRIEREKKSVGVVGAGLVQRRRVREREHEELAWAFCAASHRLPSQCNYHCLLAVIALTLSICIVIISPVPARSSSYSGAGTPESNPTFGVAAVHFLAAAGSDAARGLCSRRRRSSRQLRRRR